MENVGKMMRDSAFLLTGMSFFLLTSCLGSDDTVIMEVGKKYVLREWPDSNYVQNLDDYVEKDKTEPEKRKSGANLTLGEEGFIPRIINQDSLLKAIGEKKRAHVAHQNALNQSTQVKNSDQTEDFLENFTNQMEKLRQDPNNTKLFREVKNTQVRDIRALLESVYGAKASKIPSVLIQYQLGSLNPELNLNSIAVGEKVKIPRL